tara:strand:- start:688 stop:1083 length:396 start_codon:yes stop_codon:yes gene_type:complete
MPAGRPSTYDFELCKEICNEVADGKNIKAVLSSSDKYPVWSTFRIWKQEHIELSTLYIGSIQDKAESVDEQIDTIMKEVHDGTIEPAVANVMMQTLKWKAAKYYPKMFGDSKAVDITTNGESLKAPIDWTK